MAVEAMHRRMDVLVAKMQGNIWAAAAMLFGLRTGGRVEGVLMSLPLEARWEYAQEPASGSEEERLLRVLKTPRSWA